MATKDGTPAGGRRPRAIERFVKFISVDSTLSSREMLETSSTDYHVGLVFLSAVYREDENVSGTDGQRLYFHKRLGGKSTDDGNTTANLPSRIRIESGGRLGTVGTFPDGRRTAFGIVKSKYTVLQNEQVLEEAFRVASKLRISVSGLGRNKTGSRFAIRFSPTDERVETVDGRSETFTRTIFAFTSHDTSYTYSYAFRITDPENRPIGDVLIQRWHTAQIGDDKSLEKFLTSLAEESQEILDDVRSLAALKLDKQSLEAGLAVFKSVRNGRRASEGEAPDTNQGEQDEIEEMISEIRVSYEHQSERYGSTAWALYEAWIDVVMCRDQELQRDAYQAGDDGVILQFLAKRAGRTRSLYSQARRGLVKELVKKR